MPNPYLITGCAGFIGFHLAQRLLQQGLPVVGIDNFYPYYPAFFKEIRYQMLQEHKNFTGLRLDICDLPALESCFQQQQPKIVCHLAAQPGVRYSLRNPFIYQKVNGEGFLHILEMAHKYQISRLVYASSSSVYGNVKEVPFHEGQMVDEPVSLYAATKRANELMAYTYTHLYRLPTVGLRFFTVYGPWGRPDMAMWRFADAISQGQPIDIYNYGNMQRDFTYIDDIVAGLEAALQSDHLELYEIINLGNHQPENVMKMVSLIEQEVGARAIVRFLPLQAGDVVATYANIDKAKQKLGFVPTTTIDKGIPQFVKWYKEHQELVARIREVGCLG
jgi:UDP-glucuronate 4-epimerase